MNKRLLTTLTAISLFIAPLSYAGDLRYFAEPGTAPTSRPTANATDAVGIGSGANPSGKRSIAIGKSRATGEASFSLQIDDNTTTYGAQGLNSGALGLNAKASGNYSWSIGRQNSATGSTSLCMGNFNTCAGTRAVGIGTGNFPSGSDSFVVGNGGSANSRYGVYIYSPVSFALAGDAQYVIVSYKRTTSNNSATEMFLNGDTATARNVLTNNTLAHYRGTVVARENATGDSASWLVDFTIKRGANAAATALVGTPDVTLLEADAGAAGWGTPDISADTTNGSAKATVTGENDKTIRWLMILTGEELAN